MPLFEYSVESDASPAFAWNYWSDVRNWADTPATFTLEGPFAAGSKGVTTAPGREPTHWMIDAVEPGESARITVQLDRAVFSFEWRFAAVAENRTRLTQRIGVTGENAEAYAEAVAAFREKVPDGMNRLATTMAQAEAARTASAH